MISVRRPMTVHTTNTPMSAHLIPMRRRENKYNAHLPEVHNNFIRLSVPSIVGMLLPVIDVNIRNTANQQLQLALIENGDKVRRNEVVEAFNKGSELIFNPLFDTPLCYKPKKKSS